MIDKKRHLKIYRNMLRARMFEEKIVELFEANKLRGSVHLCIGQEAVGATVCSLLRDEDYITCHHRGHGICLAKGGDMGRAMAELIGRDTGFCKGRGGSMHIADFSKGHLGANAIVGAQIPIAVGAALGAQMLETDRIAVTFFGDASSNQGIFHEALNLAAVWKLPVIFICENNSFGISVPQWQSTSVEDISVRSAAYGIPGVTVDGNDVNAINKEMEKAVKRAKKGEGPTLIECKTYRWLGHWIGDPQVYRTREEVEAWKEKDPIKRHKEYMIKNKIATVGELDQIESEVADEVVAAEKFAFESPEPDPAHVMDDVFFEAIQ